MLATGKLTLTGGLMLASDVVGPGYAVEGSYFSP
jgi:hypothetical protein